MYTVDSVVSANPLDESYKSLAIRQIVESFHKEFNRLSGDKGDFDSVSQKYDSQPNDDRRATNIQNNQSTEDNSDNTLTSSIPNPSLGEVFEINET